MRDEDRHTLPLTAMERQLSRESVDIAKRLEQAENKIEALKEHIEELRDAIAHAGYDPDALLRSLAKAKADGTAFWR